MPHDPKQPQPQQPPIDPYIAWLQQDAARLNWLCAEARKAGIILPTAGMDPPPLNPDGSLQQSPQGKKP